jgi:hypothetical protein
MISPTNLRSMEWALQAIIESVNIRLSVGSLAACQVHAPGWSALGNRKFLLIIKCPGVITYQHSLSSIAARTRNFPRCTFDNRMIFMMAIRSRARRVFLVKPSDL